ncbi:MAG: ribonuclease P protein component [bacterium]|nr:ribonuclease P protein component [bacterium]
MPKKYRLSRADFIRLPKAARRVHGAYFSLTVTSSPLFGGPRVACVVSKKISARSVDRNRIERICRESLRPELARLKEPAALIFFAKREAVSATFGEIQRDILKLLERTA